MRTRFAAFIVLASLGITALAAPLSAGAAEATDAKPAAAASPAPATGATPAATPPAASTPSTNAAPAASTAPAAILPGHSHFGEAFDEGPRQRAYLLGNTGDVHFAVSTSNSTAQQFFDQGIGQLHGFWYFEAERSFRQVAQLDPQCAMAYWGMAMANVNNDKRAKAFIAKAMERKTNASPREQAWIVALNEYYAGPDDVGRRRAFVRALESLVQDDPNDVEAKAFLVYEIWKNGSWMTDHKKQLPISSHQAYDALLDQIFVQQPMHPAHHYRIHLWDEEKPARALVAASLCGQASPGIAHMWHMPGHTYSKLHRYADAAWQQEASARVDHAHMMRDGVLPDQIHNYAHNNEWLIRNLAFLGRVHDALDLAVNMIELPRHPKYNTPDRKGSSSGFGRTRLADVLLQYECWQQIVDWRDSPYLAAAADQPDLRLKRARMLGLASWGLNRPAEVQQQIAEVERQLQERRTARYQAADDAEAKARQDKKSADETTKLMAEALQQHRSKVEQAEHVLAELRGYAALAAGNMDQAKAEFEKIKKADGLRQDQLARAFSLAGDHAQAETIARKAVTEGPGEVYPQAILVEVLNLAGKKAEAQSEFAKLRTLAAYADLDFAVFERLKPLAAEMGLPADWRGPRDAAPDVGQRGDLARLGPFRWRPAPATSWNLPSADGREIGLSDYRGKPVIVIFYLGSGCLHCVEQLQKFAPRTSDFAAAGISLVAISSEPLDSLQGSLAKLSAKESISFPLAADPAQEVFKAYRAFDDFENAPLHGTFLIDGAGLVRWSDVGAEPFSDAAFLLEEAKRLLAHP